MVDKYGCFLQLSFDVDVQVNVFEANIRLLGGLLSGHQLALENQIKSPYDGGLLNLANDLALRLLPAFQESPTGILILDIFLFSLSC